MALLGVREAARRLGVHENTLRRWEQLGLIRAVKLPTGVRRFREEDVQRLYEEMHRGVDDAG
jgi:excisionase family DNA binding protein